MASVRQCQSALNRLATSLDAVDPELRAKHLPERTVACHVKDLGVTFTARLDESGVHDITQPPPDHTANADVRVALNSDNLIALVDREDDFVNAWLHGRIQVSASVRDMLRLRSVLGL
jgi:predicted lipid carrier protein YhbT